jgi:hypothetical protein
MDLREMSGESQHRNIVTVPCVTCSTVPPDETSFFWRVVALISTGPSSLMFYIWIAHALLFRFGPVQYFRMPSTYTWTFIIGCLFLFSLGSLTADLRWGSLKAASYVPKAAFVPPVKLLNQLALLASLIGLLGALLMLADKLLLSGLDFSAGPSAIRYQRVWEINSGIAVKRSILLYISYLTFSFAYVGVLLGLLFSESLSKAVSRCTQIALLSPIIYAAIYGGRSPMFQIACLIVAALVIRARTGKLALPRKKGWGTILLLVVSGFLVYNSHIITQRLSISRLTYQQFLDYAYTAWDLAPKPNVSQLVGKGYLGGDPLTALLSAEIYFTHSFATVDKIMMQRQAFTPYFLFYEVAVLSPLCDIMFPDLQFPAKMRAALVASNVEGFFAGAWGGLYLDFGWGCLPIIFLWGFWSKRVWQKALQKQDLGAQIVLCFVIVAIVLSPISAPLGMSNAALVLLSMLVVVRILRRRQAVSLPE